MRELRQDRITGQWVVIAPGRGDRPQQFASYGMHGSPDGDDGSQTCPFCPGNEHELPGIIAEYRAPDSAGWQVRVVPNKYAAFSLDARTTDKKPGHQSQSALGFSEVIIDTPRHDAKLTTLNNHDLLTLMQAYRERFDALMSEEAIQRVILFRNSGPLSGASLAHPHSQIVAIGVDPPMLTALENRAREYFEEHSHCLLCDEIKGERDKALRIVETSDDFTVIVPFAPQYPSEIWIIPTRHQARFDEISDRELECFGRTLRRSLMRLYTVYGAISYNFVIDSAGKTDKGTPYLHWRLRIAPKLTHWGGFELGANLPVIPSAPETDAAALRSAKLGE